MDLVTLEALARRRKISRRDFIGLAISAGLTIAAADRLFVSTAHAATPKKGGSFRLGMVGANTNDLHDPATWGTIGCHQHRPLGGRLTTT